MLRYDAQLQVYRSKEEDQSEQSTFGMPILIRTITLGLNKHGLLLVNQKPCQYDQRSTHKFIPSCQMDNLYSQVQVAAEFAFSRSLLGLLVPT
jgi:hypothetical protein